MTSHVVCMCVCVCGCVCVWRSQAPSKSLVDSTKASINAGTYESVDDVHVLATLLKVWFRELPPNLLDDVNEQTMVQVLEGDVRAKR